MQPLRPIFWISDAPGALLPGHIRILDQTKLPIAEEYIDTTSPEIVWDAIKTLKVRGAPAIGIAAAMGVAAATQNASLKTSDDILREVRRVSDYLATSRPTAVNLFWALGRMREAADDHQGKNASELKTLLVQEALAIREEDSRMCRAIGEHGAELLQDGCTILTHCNAGALATSELGTALAPVYVAAEQGKRVAVFADETRPLLQGARLTAWELQRRNIDVTVICDNTAAQVMKEGRIDMVFVGADRIAANGDTANKIGTYGLAQLAKAHGIPFYVLAPTTTIDMDTPRGDLIPIEQRDATEITCGFGKRTVPEHIQVYAPAFDVTPANLITGIICERAVLRPDYRDAFRRIAGS